MRQFFESAKQNMKSYAPISVGLFPWATATGMALHGYGLSFGEAIGMSLIVFGGGAQLGTLPLIQSGSSLWLIFFTAIILNLRFIIFSAILAPVFVSSSKKVRWIAGHLLSDGVVAVFSEKLLCEKTKHGKWVCILDLRS